MSTEDTDLLEYEDDDDGFEAPEAKPSQADSDLIRRLRKQVDKGSTFKKRVEELEFEIAVRDAGLDLTPEKRKAVLAIHEGAKTSEAIAETAKILGWGPSSPVDSPDVKAEKGIDAATNSAQSLLGDEGVGADWTPREAQAKYDAGEIDYPTYLDWMKKRHGPK